MKRKIQAEGIKPKGPYSPALMVDDYLFVSGQIGTGKNIEEATLNALKDLRVLLEAADMDMDNVIKVTLYIKNGEDFSKVNTVYGEFFHEPYPARSTVFVSSLPKDALIEIDAIARR